MKYLQLLCLCLCLVLSTSCKDSNNKTDMETPESPAPPPPPPAPEVKTITINLSPRSNSNVSGTITFTEKDGVVSMSGSLTGLTEGVHAIHLHEKADCSSPDGKSSGGHWNPTNQPHGAWGAEGGFHKGDIGNIVADAEGNASVSMSTDEWCIGCGDPNKDILGKAVIVHQGEDDLVSQPSGAAGARVSCAGIIE